MSFGKPPFTGIHKHEFTGIQGNISPFTVPPFSVLPFNPIHLRPMKALSPFTVFLVGLFAAFHAPAKAALLTLRQDDDTHTISVFRQNVAEPILTQNARPDFRPFLHPIVAPDGKGVLTEFSPSHHKHQTGLYWGLKQVNGRIIFTIQVRASGARSPARRSLRRANRSSGARFTTFSMPKGTR
jgi:hypothetical protein